MPRHFRRSWRAAATAVLLGSLLAPGVADSVEKLVPVWRVQLHKLPQLAWQPRNPATPVLHGDAVLFAAANGLHALSAQTGSKRWHHKTAEAIAGRPLIRGNRGFVVTSDGKVDAVSLKDGRRAWTKTAVLGAVVHDGLAGDEKRLFAVADPASVTALSNKSGKILWRNSRPVARDFLVEGHGAALAYKGVVYAGLATGKLVALAARDGGVVWEVALPGRGAGPYVDIDTTPVIGHIGGVPRIFVAGHNAGLHALNLADGDRAWRYDATGLGQPVLARGKLYSVASSGAIHVVDAGTGKRILGRRLVGSPSGKVALMGDTLLVPAATSLQIVAADSGHMLHHITDEYGFSAAPLVNGDTVWVLANNGTAWRMARK